MPRRHLAYATAVTLTALAAPARALPPPDPAAIWTLQDENATITTAPLTDRFYTNGLRVGWTSPTDFAPAPLATMAHALWGDGRVRISFDLTQQIYTPRETSVLRAPRGDRPYAGVLLGTFGLQSDTETARSTLSLGLGIIGPSALGKQVQNGFHDLIGQAPSRGWDSQIRDEPALQLLSSRVWRLKTGTIGGLETEALPAVTGGVGTLRVYVEGGMTFRIGQGLDADFGAPRLSPGLTGGTAFSRPDRIGWYVFAGLNGRAVAYDTTLRGSYLQNGPNVKTIPGVGEAQAGIALLILGARLTYTHVVQTQEFRHQRGGLHQFGSLALSVRF